MGNHIGTTTGRLLTTGRPFAHNWKTSGRQLGDSWETSGRQLGETIGRPHPEIAGRKHIETTFREQAETSATQLGNKVPRFQDPPHANKAGRQGGNRSALWKSQWATSWETQRETSDKWETVREKVEDKVGEGDKVRDKVGDKCGRQVGDTVGDKVPRFPEPCAYMPEEGGMRYHPLSPEIETQGFLHYFTDLGNTLSKNLVAVCRSCLQRADLLHG